MEPSKKLDTWPKILQSNAQRFGDKISAISHKRHGIWHSYTWKDYWENVKRVALGLFSLEIREGDAVLIIGDNMPEWYFSEIAVYANRGISIGLSPETNISTLLLVADKAKARFAIVEDQEQVDKILEAKERFSSIDKIIFWNYRGLTHYRDSRLLGWRELLKMGENLAKQDANRFENMVERGMGNDPCTIVLTSGSSGFPKLVMHSHKSMIDNLEKYLELDSWEKSDRILPFFPPFGLLGKWFSIGAHLLSGSILYLAERPETFIRDVAEVKPTVVFYNGKIWERRAARVQERIAESDRLKRSLYRFFMKNAYRVLSLKKRGEKSSFFNLLNKVGEPLIFKPLKKHIGLSEVKFCYNTGPLLNDQTIDFYHALRIPLKNLYWTTEVGIIAGAKNEEMDRETVGFPLKGTEIEISERNEIVVKGGHGFMGYVLDHEETSKTLRGDAFYTKDAGILRSDGRLIFLDRIADLIRLSDKKTISSQIVESYLRLSPYIKDAWVLHDPSENCLCAILIPEENNIRRWTTERGFDYLDFLELVKSEEIRDLLRAEILRINSSISFGISIKKFVILPEEPDLEMVTASGRVLRKGFLKDYYQGLIEAIMKNTETARIPRGSEEMEIRVNSV